MSIDYVRKVAYKAVSVILRVPGLFIAEAWYRTDPSSIQHQYTSLSKQKVEHPHEIVFHFLYYFALLLSLTLIILPIKKLVTLYMYLLSGVLMVIAHLASAYYVDLEKADAPTDDLVLFDDRDRIQRICLYLVVQGVISAVIAYLINLRSSKKLLLLLLYTAPMLARVANFPVTDLHKIHNVCTLSAIIVVVLFTFNNIPIVLDFLKDTVRQLSIAVHLYGWIPFLVALWLKILLPMQFLTFWIVLFGVQLYKYISVTDHPIFAEGWMVVLLASIGESCVTPMSLLGLCITVSYISYVILTITKLFLQGRTAFVQDNIMHQGWTEGFTMFLLGIQTGIIEMKSAQRVFLMSIVLFIVLSSLIQSMFEITDPILLALGASQNKNLYKHGRAVALCTFLWMAPLYMTILICQFFEIDFWLMVVVSSCILTSVQVLGSLVIYALFIYDAVKRSPWENLDDVVYYAKATTRVLEFIVALFVVCYGVSESIFGEWSFLNSSILFIHCYFNVWQRLQAGWKTYLLRREAAKKIECLPEATEEQLAAHNDVCAICYQPLNSARITPCNHFFHSMCLRKWLYVQEYCPMCHEKLPLNKVKKQTAEHQEEPGEEGDQAQRNGEEDPQDQDLQTLEPQTQEQSSADDQNSTEHHDGNVNSHVNGEDELVNGETKECESVTEGSCCSSIEQVSKCSHGSGDTGKFQDSNTRLKHATTSCNSSHLHHHEHSNINPPSNQDTCDLKPSNKRYCNESSSSTNAGLSHEQFSENAPL